MINRTVRFTILILATLLLIAQAALADAPQLKQGNARVVFVGDSITGLSRNYPTGFAHQIEWALKQTYPGCKPDLVPLGGSGQGVGSWLNIEKASREKEMFLDVPKVGVKAGLSKPADVLVIMLGMNDVLAPNVADEPAAIDRWTADYRVLITALRRRVTPTVTALATITMNTEDPDSPKNRMLAKLNDRVAALAKEFGAIVLDTGETTWYVLRLGRRLQPDFHAAYDFVHPSEPGQLAIAIAMLRGLREKEAARQISEKRLWPLLKKAAGPAPSFSYQWKAIRPETPSQQHSFRVHYWLHDGGADSVILAAKGWKINPEHHETTEGVFVATGPAAQAMNILTLEAESASKTCQRDVRIPAPWLVATGLIQQTWVGNRFDAAKARTPIDEAIARGEDFVTKPAAKGGKPLRWQPYFASVNYTGLDSPGSVDFAALTHARAFEAGYGARRIYSPKARPVRVVLGVQAFACTLHLTVSLNARELYCNCLTSEPGRKKEIDAELRPGWNVLVFKANHTAWQWQCSVDLAPKGEKSLDDLRYSIVPEGAK
jgi:lysophospholipase L1-like esterase